MRAATIYLLAAVIPITAAGLLSGNTASWYWKTAHWMMAAIAMKPVMALALTLGVGIAGGGQGLVALIVGLAVLFVALFAPLALFRLFAFASDKATEGFKSGWGDSGTGDAVNGATDKVTSMVSGSDSTSSMESSTDARYSDASSSTDTGTGDSSSAGAASGGGAQVGGPASGAASAETGSATPGTYTDRQQRAPGGNDEAAGETGESTDAHAVQQGDVAATAPADVPGEGGMDSPPAEDAGTTPQQPAENEAGSGAQQAQIPAPPTAAVGGGGEQSPAPSSSAGGAGDGAQAPPAPPSSAGGAPAPQPSANEAARNGGGGSGGGATGGAGATDAAAAAAV